MTAQKIDVVCPQCKAKLAVPTAALGKQGKCPHCQNVFPLAMPAPRAAVPTDGGCPLTPLTPLAASPASPLSPLPPLSPAHYAAPALSPLGGPELMPLSDVGLSPLAANNPFAPLTNSNPFAEAVPQGDYTLQPAAPTPYAPTMTLPSNASLASEHLAVANASYQESRQRKRYRNDGDGWGINAGIGGGLLMMLLAVVWFFGGLMAGWFYPYPIFMFIIGVIAFFKGIADNFSD